METIQIGQRSSAVDTTKIKCLVADINYTKLIFCDDSKMVVCYTLSYIQNLLPSHFVRINRGTVVNKSMVANYLIKTKFDMVLLKDKTQIKVSRRRQDHARKQLYF